MDSVRYCLKHPSQKMTLLLFSHVCDLCDPPRFVASEVKAETIEISGPPISHDGSLTIGSARVYAGGFKPGQRVYLWYKPGHPLRGANGIVRNEHVGYPDGVPCVFDPPCLQGPCTECFTDLRAAVDDQGYVLCPECNDGSRAVKAYNIGSEGWEPECEKGHRWKHTWKDGDCTNNRKTSAIKMDYKWSAASKDWVKV